MNKRSLTQALRQEYGFSWQEAENILVTILDTIRQGLRQGERVTIHDFGSFIPSGITTKKFRHIKTGRITIKAIKNRVKFKASKNILRR